MNFRQILAGAATCLIALNSAPAYARSHRQAEQPVVPQTCPQSLGTVVIKTQADWWTGQHLEDPSALLSVIVDASGCFKLVDRGIGMQLADEERARAARGNLRHGSNIGQGQVKAADYILVPQVATVNEDAGGSGFAALAGGIIGGLTGSDALAGAIGGIHTSKKRATVTLLLVNVRDGSTIPFQGTSNHTDVGWGFGAATAGTTGIGGAGMGSYQSTDTGEVVANAYLIAFNNAVQRLGGGSLPANASQAAAPRELELTRPARLYTAALPAGKPIGEILPARTRLYPTGNKEGDFVEVVDELDHKGFVSSYAVAPAQ